MFDCKDCSLDTTSEYYAVNSSLWKIANPEIDGMLCIGCLEYRLGQKLIASDFTDAPINFMYIDRKSERLKNRLAI